MTTIILKFTFKLKNHRHIYSYYPDTQHNTTFTPNFFPHAFQLKEGLNSKTAQPQSSRCSSTSSLAAHNRTNPRKAPPSLSLACQSQHRKPKSNNCTRQKRPSIQSFACTRLSNDETCHQTCTANTSAEVYTFGYLHCQGSYLMQIQRHSVRLSEQGG